MNYILIMTEGTTELALLEVLLEKGMLKFNKTELLMEKIYHSRQIVGEIISYIQLIDYKDKVCIYRVGDTLHDKLRIPKSLVSEKIASNVDISTTPELEILFIVNENLYKEYEKVKSKVKPSAFYKKYNKNYKKQKKFVYDYFSKMTNKEIFDLFQKYVKKYGKNLKRGQKNLLELIKND